MNAVDDASSLPLGVQVVRSGMGERLEEPANAAHVRPVVRFSEGSSSTSVSWVSIDGRHRPLSSRRSARCYYVLTGDLTFVLASGRPLSVRANDALVIPRGCVYEFEGTATYLVMNTPAFEPGDDEYV
jgi:mannose-6-phosphate isomerase-like protein (cupin superfamily)